LPAPAWKQAYSHTRPTVERKAERFTLTYSVPLDSTSRSVGCSPSSVAAGSATHSTAAVTGAATSGASTPAGTGTTGVATCQRTFTPSAAGGYTITGNYGGDGTT